MSLYRDRKKYFRRTLCARGTITIKWKPPLNVRHSVFCFCFLWSSRCKSANIEGRFPLYDSRHGAFKDKVWNLSITHFTALWYLKGSGPYFLPRPVCECTLLRSFACVCAHGPVRTKPTEAKCCKNMRHERK